MLSRWIRLQFANEAHKLIKATVNINLTWAQASRNHTHTHSDFNCYATGQAETKWATACYTTKAEWIKRRGRGGEGQGEKVVFASLGVARLVNVAAVAWMGFMFAVHACCTNNLAVTETHTQMRAHKHTHTQEATSI